MSDYFSHINKVLETLEERSNESIVEIRNLHIHMQMLKQQIDEMDQKIQNINANKNFKFLFDDFIEFMRSKTPNEENFEADW